MKLTDEQIKNAMVCCKDNNKKTCRYCCFRHDRYCREIMAGNALDLINRQKAEIERLKDIAKGALTESVKLCDCINRAKAEAIKEFAERFDTSLADLDDYDTLHVYEIKDRFDSAKEMVGTDK